MEEGREENQGVKTRMKMEQGQWKSKEDEAFKRRRKKMNKRMEGKKSENRKGKKLVEKKDGKKRKSGWDR